MKNMKKRKIMLGPLAMQFFAWTQLENKEQVKTGDFAKVKGLSAKQEADLLYKLSSSGIIVKLWRGLYLVPPKIPLGGPWAPSPYLVVSKYMRNLDAKFQISGPAIFNLYGYFDQVSSWFTVYNNKVSKKLYILQYHLNFVKVIENRLGDVKKRAPYGVKKSKPALVSSAEQALLDAVYDYKKYGTLPKAYDWIAMGVKDKKIDPEKLVNIVIKYGNKMSQKRIGWVLDELKVSQKILSRLEKKIPKTKFLVPLNPRNNVGPVNKRWRVIENVKFSSRK